MTPKEKPRFVQAILAMAATFRTEPSEPLYQGYWMGLSDLPLEAVEQAIATALRTSEFLPTVARIRELAGVRAPDPAERSTKAWATVMDCMGRLDYYDSVSFDDPVVHATIRALGGWMRFWERLEGEGREWLGKEFTKGYQHLMATGFSDSAAGYLAGYFEVTNNKPQKVTQVSTGLPPPILPRTLTGKRPPAIGKAFPEIKLIGVMP